MYQNNQKPSDHMARSSSVLLFHLWHSISDLALLWVCYLMDRFLKRPAAVSASSSNSAPRSKRPAPAAKQGNVTADQRVCEFDKDKFYADGGKLFCRICNEAVEHIRKYFWSIAVSNFDYRWHQWEVLKLIGFEPPPILSVSWTTDVVSGTTRWKHIV